MPDYEIYMFTSFMFIFILAYFWLSEKREEI